MSQGGPDNAALRKEAVADLAERLVAAERSGAPIRRLSVEAPSVLPADAYRIQLEGARRRTADGETLLGMKVGLTSRAVQEAVGGDEPVFGHLWGRMRVPDGGTLPLGELIRPRVEPELAFVLAHPLRGPQVSAADALEATGSVAAALEIVDSRFEGGQPAWVDIAADNGGAARFVLSEDGISPVGFSLATLELVFERNGVVLDTALLGEVMGDPIRSVAWLANELAAHGAGLPAGSVVLPGSPCASVAAAPGDTFAARISGIGSASLACS